MNSDTSGQKAAYGNVWLIFSYYYISSPKQVLEKLDELLR